MQTFENTIEKHISDKAVKLTRRLQYISGEVHNAIQSCSNLDAAHGYQIAKAMLK